MTTAPTRQWTARELAALDAAFSIILAARTDDGSPPGTVEVGLVVTLNGVFVRAWRGPVSGWFQATQAHGQGTIRYNGRTVPVRFQRAAPQDEPAIHDSIDHAYVYKYGAAGSAGIATDEARATTVRITPITGTAPMRYETPC
ncbi:DUF2255 family protein [Streptomyces sp. NPDC056628]|uniref:DUF2255 family protein n=1 Tax=Streptomyces sp. NPDC056628 TaxID=3345882 RepID=UPI0036A9A548